MFLNLESNQSEKINKIFTFIVLLSMFIFFVFSLYNSNKNLSNQILENHNLRQEIDLYINSLESEQIQNEVLRNKNKKIDEENIGIKEELGRSKEYINKLEDNLKVLHQDNYMLKYIGGFNITYYCDERYPHICGGSGITASGKPTEIGWTIAADWGKLPKGSIVYIEGIGFREVQDVGSAVDGNHIDVLVETHEDALKQNLNFTGVWLLVKGK